MQQMESTMRKDPKSLVKDTDVDFIKTVVYQAYYSKIIDIFTLNFITAPLLL